MSKSDASSSTLSDSPASLLSWLLEVEGALATLAADDDYSLYELLHCSAAQIARVDACYICLYGKNNETLYFPYNFDLGLYDEPITIARGDGPASWVISHAAPFVLSSETREIQDANVNFGDCQRVSQSALHAPLLAHQSDATNEAEVIGVFSIQSYQPDVYDSTTLAALQLLCNRAAAHLQNRRQQRAHVAALSELSRQVESHQAHKIAMSNLFVELSNPITREVQELASIAHEQAQCSPLIRERIEHLCRLCFRLQTDISLMPTDDNYLSQTPAGAATPLANNALQRLSKAELKVLELLATGASNRQLAQRLRRTEHTVKQHCKSIFRKLGVQSRSEAAHLYGVLNGKIREVAINAHKNYSKE